MTPPEFTEAERAIIDSMKVPYPHSAERTWGPFFGSLLIFGVAAYQQNIPIMACIFSAVCFFRLQDGWDQERWAPIFRTIFRKYDAAVQGVEYRED